MADSDDEYSTGGGGAKRRVDKFRGERSDYSAPARRAPPMGGLDDVRVHHNNNSGGNRREEWGGEGRSDWSSRRPPPMRPIDYRLGGGPPRQQQHEFSPPPPVKRYDRYSDSGFSGGSYSSGGRDSDPPSLLSFKSWLSTQDDSISDEEALKKYADYKLEYRRQQLNEFFVQHREEEWFKNKYHPDESSKKREEAVGNLKKRSTLFLSLYNNSKFSDVTLDPSSSDKLVKLMDWYVVRLEGGSDEDAQLLLEKPVAAAVVDKPAPPTAAVATVKEEVANKQNGGSEDDDKIVAEKMDEEKREDGQEEGEEKEEKEDGDSETEASSRGEKRKATSPSLDEENKHEKILPPPNNNNNSKEEIGDPGPPLLHRTASIFLRNLSPAITKQEVEDVCKKYEGYLRVAIADPQPDRRWSRRGWVTFKRSVNIKEICWNFNSLRLRDTELGAIVNRDLTRRIRTVNGITPHKTIVRNDIRLAANVIQALDAKWGLFKNEEGEGETDKKSYGVYSSNPVLKNITDYLIEEASAEEDELLGMSGGGPGSDGEIEEGGGDKNSTIERDDELISVLDRLILYLRFVHSIDYYNHAEYPYEDDMPNRLGIIHGRGLPPATKVTPQELQDYCKNFESKISTFAQPTILLSDEEVAKLGKKDEETEVEKFITSNTQELGKDKWLCPLSGKKFKGPEFVRKHITNKHGEKVEEVRKEVTFFNNYLRDPKRPSAPEQGGGPRRESRDHNTGGGGRRDYGPGMMEGGFHPASGGGGYGGGGPPYTGGYYPPRPVPYGGGGGYGGGYYPPPSMRGRMGYNNRGGYDGGGGRRPMISYRDLDAPNEMEDF